MRKQCENNRLLNDKTENNGFNLRRVTRMSNETTYNVFISYSWNYNKTLVNDLYRFLAKNGIRAWKDDEGGMAGSTIRSMQSGIKTATGLNNSQ